MTAEKQQALEYLSKKSGLPLVNCMYDLPLNRVNNEAENSYFRPIEHWLDLIDSARYMITDSFHGSVFSIIFNTDFICFGNKNRGNSRFDSLFGKLNLTHCLVSGGTTPSIVKQSENVWKDINSILTQWRERGEKYLKNNLNL